MTYLTEILQYIADNMVDVLIYTAIGIVALTGFIKCIFPLRSVARSLRVSIRTLDKMPTRDTKRPIWQNELFAGKKLSGAWRDFLNNFDELDKRGMTCDVRDYINDDSVIYGVSNIPLSEMIPGLLTSLGILGTFIGLVRGLGGLDVSDASKTMESIPKMIAGMTFAFSTSIAGVACSLVFNILNRAAVGSAEKAMEEFTGVFGELVMQPAGSETRLLCGLEDQTLAIRQGTSELTGQMSERVAYAIEKTLVPVTQSMNNFIMGQTQAQMEGLAMITQHFIESMNASLGGQFMQLGQTLSQVNRAQQVSVETFNQTMATAEQMMQSLNQVQQVTIQIADKFDSYVSTLAQSRQAEDEFTRNAAETLMALERTRAVQSQAVADIRTAQTTLQESLNDYALRSKQTMQRICDQADETGASTRQIAAEMKESGQKLKDSYASFVENISLGLSRTMGMFDESMNGVVNRLKESLSGIQSGDNAKLVTSLSRLEQTLTEIRDALPEKE